MPNNKQNLVVYFDESLWKKWGLAWTASAYYLSCFKGRLIVVDCGLSSQAITFLKKLNYTVIPSKNNLLLTIANFAKDNLGVYATWDYSCYFQDDINHIFDISSDYLVCCRDTEPHLISKLSLGSFGYQEEVCTAPDKFFKILKLLARQHGCAITGSFLAGPSNLWQKLCQFENVIVDTGFLLPPTSLQASLNLFVRSCDYCCKIESNKWCQPISNELTWKDDGFYLNSQKSHVISIPRHLQNSANNLPYQFCNRYNSLYEDWATSYKGCFIKPKRIIKPKLSNVRLRTDLKPR